MMSSVVVVSSKLTSRVAFALLLVLALGSARAHAQTGSAEPPAPSPAPAFGGALAPVNAPAATSETPPLPAQGQQASVIPIESSRPVLPVSVNTGPLTGGRLTLLRFNENWCGVKLPPDAGPVERAALRTKCIPLGDLADSYVTFSGEERFKLAYEKTAILTGYGKPDQTLVFFRHQLGADVHISPYFRVFAEIIGGTMGGWNVPAFSPRQRDTIEVGELFAEAMLPLPDGGKIAIRVGRERYFFGNGLIVSSQPVPNIPQSFNGAHAYLQNTYLRVDAFAAHATTFADGSFNDRSADGNRLSGVYASAALPRVSTVGLNVDPFVIHSRKSDARYNGFSGTDSRYTVGARLWGEAGPFSVDWTVAHQFGRFGTGNVSATAAFVNTAYVFDKLPNKPQLGGRFDYMSGGRSNSTVHTWDPLYLRPEYFTPAGFLAGSNLVDFGPTASIDFPAEKIRLEAAYLWFYRQSAADAIYGGNFVPLPRSRGAPGSNYMAQQVELGGRWDINPNLQVTGAVAWWKASEMLRRIGGRNLPNGGVNLTTQF